MRFWIGCFCRFHADPAIDLPVAIKTVDCPVVRSDGSCHVGADGKPIRIRCVWEITRNRASSLAAWLLICWEIAATHGIHFTHCATLAEALALFERHSAPVHRP